MASIINQIKLGDVKYAIAASAYAECSTAAETAAKVAAICTDGDTKNTAFTLIKGVSVNVKFTTTNTASSPTLNINSTGAKAIYYNGAAITAGYIKANRVYQFLYDGSYWQLVSDVDTAKSVETINGKTLKFFAGEQSEYDDLDDAQKENLYAVVTDDKTYDNIIADIAAINARLDALRHPYKPTMRSYGTTLYVHSPGADAFRVKLERADGTGRSMEHRFTADEADAGIDINTYSPTYIGASKAYVITAQACSWGKLASQVSVLTYIPPEPEDPEEPWVPEPSYSLSGDYVFENYLDTPWNEFEESVQFTISDYNGNSSEYAKMVYRDGVLYARSSAGTDISMYLFNTIPNWRESSYKNITVIRTDNLSKEFYDWFIGNTTPS